MIMKPSTLSSYLFYSIYAAALLHQTSACNVCRGNGDERYLVDPSHAFTMRDPNSGETADWTCGYLQEVVEDVENHEFLCGLSQTWAEWECECGGPPIAPLSAHVHDPNPACNLCIDSRTVPAILENELVQTGVAGRMPCGGLYDALAEGVLPENLCSTVQANAADFCCNVPALEVPARPPTAPNPAPATPPAPPPVRAPTQPSCLDLYDNCDGGGNCCGSFVCKTRIIGQPRVCSSRAVRKRTSLAGNKAGGAGAQAKYAH